MEHLQQRLQDAETRLEALGEMRNGAERISKSIAESRIGVAQRNMERADLTQQDIRLADEAISIALAYIHSIELHRTETQP
jgi:hypothetical protein